MKPFAMGSLCCLLAGACGRKVSDAPAPEALQAIARTWELDARWSFDAKSQLLAIARETGTPGLVLIDTSGKAPPRELGAKGRWPNHPILSPGASWLAFQDRPFNDSKPSLYLLDLKTGAQRTLFTSSLDEFYRETGSFSPAGTELVFEIRKGSRSGFEDVLVVVELTTGATRELLRSPSLVSGPTWMSDGFIYFHDEASLARIAESGGSPEILATVAHAKEARGGGSVAVAPNGSAAAFAVELDDCAHVAVVGLDAKHDVKLLECGFGPVWSASNSDELIYIAYPGDGSRVPRVINIKTGQQQSLGFDPGVTAAIASDPSGAAYVLTTQPGVPRSAWRVNPVSNKRELIFGFSPGPAEPDVLARWTAKARDGITIPVLVFPSTCPQRSHEPVIVFLHGGQQGKDETPPRFMREIAYLNRAGAIVVAPNVRNSIGYGVKYRELPYSLKAQLTDLETVIDELQRRPELAGRKLFVFSISSANTLEAAYITTHPDELAGAINWVSIPDDLLTAGPLENVPPMLWLSGRDEKGALKHTDVAAALRERGLRIRHVVVNADHTFRSAEASADALDQVRRFLLERATLDCGR